MSGPWYVAVGRPALSMSGVHFTFPIGSHVEALSDREVAILDALSVPVRSAGVTEVVRARLAANLPEALRSRAVRRSRMGLALLSMTRDGRRWRDYLSHWSDEDLAGDIARLERRGCIRTFTVAHTDVNSGCRGVGIICGRRGPAVERLLREIRRSRSWSDEQVAVVSGNFSDEAQWPTHASVKVLGRRSREAFVARLPGRAAEQRIARFALEGDGRGPSIGANRNLLTLASGYASVVSLDDDVHCQAFRRRRAGPRIQFITHLDDPRRWTASVTMAALRRDVTRVEEPLPTLLTAPLGRRFRDVVALEPSIVWPDLMTSRGWSERWWQGQVRLAWAGVLGHTGIWSTRRVLEFEGPSRSEVVERQRRYRALTSSAMGAACPDNEVIHPLGFFAGGGFAYSQDCLVPPFPPDGRCEEAVFGAVLGKIDPDALSSSLPVMIHHEPIEHRRHEHLRTDISLTCNHVLAILVTESEVPERSTCAGERMMAVGRYLETFAAQSSSTIAAEIASRVTRDLEAIWDHLFQLRARHRGPSWWRRDLDESCARIRQVLRIGHPASVCEAVIQEGLEVTSGRIEQFGRLLQAWPHIWNNKVDGVRV